MIKSLCVFCGSSPGSDPVFAAAAEELGTLLARREILLVYGGASAGLMGTLANACLAAGGKAIGVIPKSLTEYEIVHHELTELHVVDSMHERKALMGELADGFVSLPGGVGTLEEMFETLTWSQLGIHQKPCGLLNVDGYFSQLIGFLDNMVEKRFLLPEHKNLLCVHDEAAALLESMAVLRPAEAVAKWVDRHTGANI